MPPKSTVDCNAISRAIHDVGVHPGVPVTVTDATIHDDTQTVTIKVTLCFLCASPVCCPEPGCYIPFLGHRRSHVPAAIGAALNLKYQPSINIQANLVYETGYRHTELNIGAAQSCEISFAPAYFVSGHPVQDP